MTTINRTAKIPAAKKPSGGETTRLATCFRSADHLTPLSPPAAAIPAPHRPPIKAWVELLGSPRYHVMRFQEMAPSRAAITTTSPGLIARVLAMVFDTLAWKNATVITAPTRLKTAARPTAARGESARVEIDVAMALAVSWKPLVKSKATAIAIVTHSRIAVSCILDCDRLHYIGGVLAGVHRRLEQVVDVLPLHEFGGFGDAREQLADRVAHQPVALVLEAMDLDAMRFQLREPFKAVERCRDLDAGLCKVFTHLLGRVTDRANAVQIDFVTGFFGEVDDVVQA